MRPLLHRWILRGGALAALLLLVNAPTIAASKRNDHAATLAAMAARSGLVVSPPRATPPMDDVSSHLGPGLGVNSGFAHRAEGHERPRTSSAIGAWSDLVSAPPSQRLHHTATYDPIRRRIIVFGGLAHVWVFSDLAYFALDKTNTWHHLESDDAPPPRWGHSAVYDPDGDQIIVFGGMVSAYPVGVGDLYPRSDVWALSLRTLLWRQIEVPGEGPSARYVHTAIYDPVGRRMIVFGGYDGEFRKDVWALSLDGDAHWTRLAPTGTAPPPLDAAAADYDPVRHRMLVFGGFDGHTSRNETWALSLGDSPEWSQVTTLGVSAPGPRRQHSATYDSALDRLIVFGGNDDSPYAGYDDVWALNLQDVPAWHRLATNGSRPSRRWGQSMLFDPDANRVVLFGGVDLDDWRNDTWELDFADNTWRTVGSIDVPPARWGHTSVYDAANDRLVVFSGAGQSHWLDDFWTLDLGGPLVWHRETLGGTQFARQGATAVNDPVRSRVLFFGGGPWPDDTVWEVPLVGTPTASRMTTQGTRPTPRTEHSAIYDPVRQRMILFGGQGETGDLSDVWSLSLSDATPTWSRFDIRGAAPEPRHSQSAVYDPVNDRMIVFGGDSSERDTALDDVWALSLGDGTPRWERIESSSPPSARYEHVATWDAVANRMIVFGGFGPRGWRNDTWSLAFSGPHGQLGTWEELDPRGEIPARRAGHTGVVDTRRNRLIVFGGKSDTSFFDGASALDLTDPQSQNATPAAAMPAAMPAGLSITRLELQPGGRALVRGAVQFPATGSASLDIIDVRGRRIAHRVVEAAAGNTPFELNVDRLPRGRYWIWARQQGHATSAAFTVTGR